MAAPIEEFRRFVADAADLSRGVRDRLPVAQFAMFAGRAAPLAIASVTRALPSLARRASLMNRWLTEQDLLQVAGLAYAENPYIELLAWALRAETDPASAAIRQRAWLAILNLTVCPSVDRPVEPVTQYITPDGRPDLLLHYSDGVIIVEVKTGTEEHETPSGLSQTEAYPSSVRQALQLAPDIPVQVVFLTPGREQPKNPLAIPTTFVEFVLALAEALDGCNVPIETAWAYRMLFTHLLGHASPGGGSIIPLVRFVAEWSRQPDWDSPKSVVRRLPDLIRACRVLMPGEWNE